jgi:spore coat protein JB
MANDRMNLLKMIQRTGFAITEANLFLDTHPTCQAALEYYERYRVMYLKLMNEYTATYGPLRVDAVPACNEWTWIDHPWPWEE